MPLCHLSSRAGQLEAQDGRAVAACSEVDTFRYAGASVGPRWSEPCAVGLLGGGGMPSGGRTPGGVRPGWSCSLNGGRARGRAAEAAAEAVWGWRDVLGEGEVRVLRDSWARIAPYGPLGPSW